ncbi:hypothetical protein [Vibrio sp. D431a]|uniref:hypothetical protein n=1 Tax=Vibrio sp. D431a TaxID=2837388 RepID=UPI00255477D6|nr:hypothetical protein [Vibrio sp. D431a]MDK9789781.1 hypothetical protein [Vibrio sp. D431a]
MKRLFQPFIDWFSCYWFLSSKPPSPCEHSPSMYHKQLSLFDKVFVSKDDSTRANDITESYSVCLKLNEQGSSMLWVYHESFHSEVEAKHRAEELIAFGFLNLVEDWTQLQSTEPDFCH